jgi:hypothetical protein
MMLNANFSGISADIDMMIYIIEVSIEAFVPVVLSIICYTEKHFIFLRFIISLYQNI